MITMLEPTKVPAKLMIKYQENGFNIRKLEKVLNVNRYYIYQLLRYGKEPTRKTKKGIKAREALFLEKERKQFRYEEYILEWRRLPIEVRHRAIREFVDWYYRKGGKEKFNDAQKERKN